MSKKVYIIPQFPKPDRGDGGIRRVCEAQIKHLPAYGWEVTDDPWQADVINCHAGNFCELNIDRPWVASSHGLYWTAELDFGEWAQEANAQVLINLKRADIITTPSEWVAQSHRRGICCEPVVIGHGIDAEEWEPLTVTPPEEASGYVLWNKARADVVCDPTEVEKLAGMARQVKFVSTFGQQSRNLTVLGKAVPYGEMRDFIQRAGVYLCTARETFGIGTLEAMACGVPVLGWAHGGQVDIVGHKEHGYLAKPGDFDDLYDGLIYCLNHRDELGQAAREHVLQHYRWADVIGQYAAVYERALSAYQAAKAGPRTSIIITCYKLSHLLPECLDSIAAQQDANWECIVVDDASPDDTAAVVRNYAQRDDRFRYVGNVTNQYLAEARNVGIRESTGRYILPLDADDLLTPQAIGTLAGALDRDHSIDIAYGHMEAWYPERPTGQQRERGGWPAVFQMEGQMRHRNQLPYASMYRRRAWARIGGYRQHIRTAEDADTWCRMVSYGFKPAKVSEAVYLVKRELQSSMSRVEPVSRDWTDWFPWARDSRLTPFGAVLPSDRRPERHAWLVRSHASPRVSVVIPVGPGHERAVVKAADSVVAQTMADWEIVVVNDTGQPLSLPGFPFAVQVESEGHGAGAARNTGARAAKGQYLVFLDADDWLHPRFLQRCLAIVREGQREYVYTNATLHRGEAREIYDPGDLDGTEHLLKSQHAVSALLPRALFDDVGGFDESMMGWEDWDFYIASAVAGWCPVHLPEVLVAYDLHGGQRREAALVNKADLLTYIKDKWAPYYKGEKTMACGGCGKRNRAPAPPAPTTQNVQQSVPAGNSSGAVLAAVVDALVMVEYLSPNIGGHSVRGQATRTHYGYHSGGEHFYLHPRDIDAQPHLFRRV